MKKAVVVALLVLDIMAFQAAAFAIEEEAHMQGQVVSVDTAERFLTITRTNAITGKMEKFDLIVPVGTAFQGVGSLDKLEAGRQVKVDALRNPNNGNWETQTVTVT